MNIKNALGFLVLGLLMLASPSPAHAGTIADISVRTVWLEFMGWVIVIIGSAFLLRDAAVHVPAWLTAITPERWLRPTENRYEPLRLPADARAGVAS